MSSKQLLYVAVFALGLAACETAPEPVPAPVPEPTPTPEPTPEYELWMGPRPSAAPTLKVDSSGMGPVVDQNGNVVTSRAKATDDMPAALAAAHSILLKRQGRTPLYWSEKLESQAASIAKQLSLDKGPYSYCARSYSVNYSVKNEAIHIAPPVQTTSGLRRDQTAGARDIATQWAQEHVGAFDAINRFATQMGCAKTVCPQTSEIWVCRFE